MKYEKTGQKVRKKQKQLTNLKNVIIFAEDFNRNNIMCTVTLSYDHNNALARRKLAILLSSGLFTPTVIDNEEPSSEEVQAHRQMVEAFLHSSKNSMSHVIARYL